MPNHHTARVQRRRRALATAAVAALLCAAPAAAETVHAINIPAGPLDAALKTLAAQTGQQLLYPPEIADGREAPAVAGRFTPEAALARLLGDEVRVARAGDNVLVLKPGPPAPTPAAAAPARPEVPSRRPFGGEAPIAPPGGADPAAVPRQAPHTVEALQVTGTHLRGVTDTPSPVLVLDRTDLERSGHLTVAAALAALPQNFAGNATEGTILRGVDRASTNNTYGSGISLRGLGADATLVLVNGRRMAGAGVKGDFVDVSAIPTAAVERVEILLDGASALYGSDAVGGVVNIILRQSFAGGESQLSAGSATAGEPREARFSHIAGTDWGSGSGVFAYELHRREALLLADRAFTASADLRPLGGSDRRQTFAHPGNIMVRDPVTNTNVPGWAIPEGQDGTDLQPGDLLPGAVNRGNQNAGVSLLPKQTRHGLYGSVRQDVGEALELTADVRWSYRRFRTLGGWPVALITAPRTNPYFVSPVGAASHQVAYWFVDDLAPTITNGSAESLAATLGAGLDLPGDWRADGYLAFAQEIGETRAGGLLHSTFLNEATGAIADRPNTPFRTSVDGFFNPFGAGPGDNDPAILAFISSGFSTGRTRDRAYTANLKADGSLVELPGGPLRLALGAQVRRETFFRASSSFTSGVAPARGDLVDARRTVWAAFAEARAPLLGADSPAGRLEFSLAGRYERYEGVGDTANPKLGLIWAPRPDVTLRGSYGTSFRAPALRELRDAERYAPSLLPFEGGRVLTLIQSGGNPDLKPETATAWTLGADYAPEAVPGLRLSLTWFRTRFEDRIDTPGAQNVLTALSDPAVSSFVTRVDPGNNPADRARVASLIDSPNYNPASGVFPAESYGAILDGRYANTAVLAVEGVDLQAAYAWTAGTDRFGLSGNLSYLFDYGEQLTPTGPLRDRVGTASYPVRLRARVAADWARGPWGATLAVNHASGARDLDGRRIDDQQTVDLQVRAEGAPGARLADLRVALNVRNLFAADPPFYDSPGGLGFDSANADPIGRFVSLQLTRRW